MKRYLAAGIALTLTLASCSQVDRAVKGQQNAPGWQMAGQSRTEMTSDVQYLGASADGLIIVRLSSGQTQIWKSGQ